MSIDILHEKIRKLKCPIILDLSVHQNAIPPAYTEGNTDDFQAYLQYCDALLDSLKGLIPGVRVPWDTFALSGPQGMAALQSILKRTQSLGYYVILDGPGIFTPWSAERAAEKIFDSYPCHGLVISPYIGSDAVKPFVPLCREGKYSLFVMVRSANKTASELQDLMTGSRLVHTAAAELVKRYGETIVSKCGYSRISLMASATAPEALRSLRSKNPWAFLLVDGIDYPSGNAKSCSYAFDRMGYGAAVCIGPGITAAWKEEGAGDCLTAARDAVERYKKNISRYITIL